MHRDTVNHSPDSPATRGERWRKRLCLAPQDTNSNAIALPHAGRGGASGRRGAQLSLLVHSPDDRPPQAFLAADELAGLGGAEVARPVSKDNDAPSRRAAKPTCVGCNSSLRQKRD